MNITKDLRSGVYPSEIVLKNVVEYLECNTSSDSQSDAVKMDSKHLLEWIQHWKLEVQKYDV